MPIFLLLISMQCRILDEKKLAIIGTLKEKSVLKQKVFDNTLESFRMVKEILKNLSREINSNLEV